MRLPSVATALRRAGEAAARFPLALASAIVAAGGLVTAIEGPERHWVPRLIVTAVLGVSLFTATSTTAERLRVRSTMRWAVELALVTGLAILYRASLGWTDVLTALRFAQLLVAAHLLVAVLPYLRSGSLAGFWQFNRSLFLRFLIGGIYAAVLWVGLAVALLAIQKLLGVPVRREWYPELLVILGFAVHPWFVLAGVPEDFDRLESFDDYPLGLKVFAQFVLIPLVSVYVVILTIYLGRVIVTRTWPSGWIGWLVSSVSAVGVLALLLVHPVRERADSRWVDGYGRWFFVVLLPSLGMLLVAAGKRIGQYGVTEPRYFLVVLGLWMVGLAVYYGITASRNIKVIPASLAVVALLTAVGPWSAFSVSTRSQAGRFRDLLAANGVTGPGSSAEGMSWEDRRQATAILWYLAETHGANGMARATGLSADSLTAWGADREATARDAEALALGRLGIEYVGPGNATGETTWRLAVGQRPIDVTGFDRQYPVALTWGTRVTLSRDSLALRFDGDRRVALVEQGADTVLTLPLGPAIDSLTRAASAEPGRLVRFAEPVVLEGAAGDLTLRLVLTSLDGAGRPPRATVSNGSGFLLVRRR